ncbi:hypothetical protein [Roseibium sp. M-1]
MASGRTKIGSEIDFAGSYLKHVLGFVGKSGLTFVIADLLMKDPTLWGAALVEAPKLAA